METVKHPVKKYPEVGVCGLDCDLCPMHYTQGASKCPGCCGPGFREKHPSCSLITCCVKQKNLETCALCADWAQCEKVGKRLSTNKDSVISYKPIAGNFAFMREHGIEAFARLEKQKAELLSYLLANYNDGRSKILYCTVCQLIPIAELKITVKKTEAKVPKDANIKEKAIIIRAGISELADGLKIDLKLRK